MLNNSKQNSEGKQVFVNEMPVYDDAALLQEYQDQLINCINEYPAVIDHINWLTVTNGFDPNIVNLFIRCVYKKDVMEKLVERLNTEWEMNLTKHDLRMYVDPYTCDILRYGSEECPVRFSTFLDENKRMWLERELD